MTLFSTLNEPYILLLFLYLGATCGLIYFTFCRLFSLLDRRKLLKTDVARKKDIQNKYVQNVDKDDKTSKKDGREIGQKSQQNLSKNRAENIVEINQKNTQKLSKNLQKNCKKSAKNLQKNNLGADKNFDKKNRNKFLLKQQKKIKKEQKKQELKKYFVAFRRGFLKIIVKISQIIAQTGKFALFVALCFATFLINLKLNYGEINFFCLIAYVFSFFVAKYFLKIVANFFSWLYTKFVIKKANSGKSI